MSPPCPFSHKLTNPEIATLQKISNELHFPVKFFLENCPIDIKDSPTYFRSLLTTGKRYHKEQEAKLQLIKIIYEYLSEYLTFQPTNLPVIDKDADIEDIASALRDCWGLGRKPIDNLVYKAESNGLIVIDFDVDMSFSPEDISGMLAQYEDDHHTGMNIHEISDLIYEYTSGYPFLVSRLCKLMDEKIAPAEHFADTKNVWTKSGFLGAVKLLLSEKNALFESLIGKLNNYPALRHMLYLLLFQGQAIMYNADDTATDMLLMFGFLKAEHETVRIANRIFETRLYNYFLTLPEAQNGDLYRLALQNRNLFIQNGQLDMKCVLAKFVEHFDDIYGDLEQTFYEEDGRRYFMLYLKPIINGVGNYYVEAQTRNQERTDLIIDYLGIQYIIEMKVWRGNAYNKRGEQQLIDYLDHYHLKTGYMLSFNFNQKKTPGIKEIRINDKILIEAVV